MIRSYSRLLARIKEACQQWDYEYQVLGKVGPSKQFELARVIITPSLYKKTVGIVGGVHGDEPAPVEAAVQFLEEGVSGSTRPRIILYPCLNPWGYVHDKRKNGSSIDLNRTRSLQLEPEQSLFLTSLLNERLDFFLAMHEDWWSTKLYAFVFGKKYSGLYSQILNSAEEYLPIHRGKSIDGVEASDGLVLDQHDSSLEDIVSRTGIPCMCSETGKKALFKSRIDANKEMMKTISTL